MQSTRFTVATLQERIRSVVGTVQNVPHTRNKGAAGLALEVMLGIPASPACLDCSDGELKAFPLKRLANGSLVPKETVAVTMCTPELLKTQSFQESRCRVKLANTLFVPYMWEMNGDITFYTPILFTESHPLFHALEADYTVLQTSALEGILKSNLGTYLQTRTKGAGHGSTSRAFYLRPSFIKALFKKDGFTSTYTNSSQN